MLTFTDRGKRQRLCGKRPSDFVWFLLTEEEEERRGQAKNIKSIFMEIFI
jgi:hypothetical protein